MRPRLTADQKGYVLFLLLFLAFSGLLAIAIYGVIP